MPTFEIPDGPTTIDVARPSDPKTVAPSALQRRQATIEAALARAKAARAGS